MTPQRVLFMGGSGIISTACVSEAVRQGHNVYCLNRGASDLRPLPPEVTHLVADVRDPAAVASALAPHQLDVVVQFLGFTPDHVQADVAMFAGQIKQYIYVSSASAYQTPPTSLPVRESTPLRNPHWQYSRDKIACETVLETAYREDAFPATIVRPSHTYDPTMIPFDGGWTVMDRMIRGKEVIVPGDGNSLWTITHHTDFARALVPLIGRTDSVGQTFHITSDETPTWNAIYEYMARAAGVEANYVYVPSTHIADMDPEWGAALLGDKAHSMIFDNSKIKAFVPGFNARVPFEQGASEIIAWYDAHPENKTVDPRWDSLFDRLADQHRIGQAPRPTAPTTDEESQK